MGELVRVASVSDLPPGEQRVVEVGEREIALFNVGGTIHAIDDECPHAGFPLSEGDVAEGEWVICPGHSFYYNLKTGECKNDPGKKVSCFEVVVEGDDVKVRL